MNDTRWPYTVSSDAGVLSTLMNKALRTPCIVVLNILLTFKARLRAFAAKNHKLEVIIHRRTEKLREQRDKLKVEQEKTQALLRNILPEPIAEELRETGAVAPLKCDDVTVCFTDFVGFTLASEKLSACDLVDTLHRYFSKFDEIIGRYGLEKLKTIGDSYMFVSGLPQQKPSHAIDAVLAALEIVEAVKELAKDGPGWSIRIGLHSGPVVAGVVGTRKFAFDIWGETVNLASRIESCSRPNHVNISARTYDLVRDYVECQPRGPVMTKEGRCLDMYFACEAKFTGANGTAEADSGRAENTDIEEAPIIRAAALSSAAVLN
jgi:class 3 adenylate cyclase